MKTIRLLVLVVTAVVSLSSRGLGQSCAADNAGLTLPRGFCALVAAVVDGSPRHMAVASNGDLFVALNPGRDGSGGGLLVLRDTDGDGSLDVQRRHDNAGGTGIALRDGYLYFGTDDEILRYPWRPGALEPAGSAETVAGGLFREGRWHSSKGFAIDRQGSLFVNIGVPSNICQQRREPGAPGHDPCPLLEQSAGIWRFDANRPGQSQADGERFATGVRNMFALAVHPQTGDLYGAQHGRDGLHQLWPKLFSEVDGAEKPAEEFVKIERGDNFGWPYCFYDPIAKRKVQGPEYGGDGKTVGRCADKKAPVIGFPGHWAPNALAFYTGRQFPEKYRGGAFVAFHGSWNRAPRPQAGYNVTFVPFTGGRAVGEYEVFADGFAGADVSPRGAVSRPSGLVVGPDGSLFVSDDKAGKIFRIMYRRGE